MDTGDYADRLATLAGFERAVALGRYGSAPVNRADPSSNRRATPVAATLTSVDFEYFDALGPTIDGIDPAQGVGSTHASHR